MPLGIGSTKSTSLFALNALRVNQLNGQTLMAQLSSGNRLVTGAIDPSGLAISQGFRAQIGGTEQAIYNAQDNVNLTRTADATLGSQTEMLGRMRDLAVRGANDATLTDADRQRLNTEYQAYNAELTRQGQASNYNTKPLTTDVAGQQYGTQATQVDPNAGPQANVPITINPSTAQTLGTGGGGAPDLLTGAGARAAITQVDQALANVSSQRANLGITENRFGYITNDLNTQRINLSAANSRIADTDMAEGATSLARNLLLNKTGLAGLAASNAQAYGVLKLLGAA